jgi:signal transduction histidine kinase
MRTVGDRTASERAVAAAGSAPEDQRPASALSPPDPRRDLAELEAVLQAIPDGVMVFDREETVIRMNPAAEAIWRRAGIDLSAPRAEVLARFQLRGEDGRPLPHERWPVSRALLGETVHGMHLTFTPGRARPLWMLASAAPIRERDGSVTGAVLTFSDETAVHELAEARDDLVRMVSHDLRAPLSAIYGQAHLIRRGAGAPDKVEVRAAAIERSCERMSGMIQDLVEVTLLEAGQLPLAQAQVDLAALLPDIVDGMRGGLDVDRVRLEVQSPCRASLDPARLERIVVNLVSNALKYSSGEVQVIVHGGEGGVVLTVVDRGIGISPEDQARIFERYYRARGERQPEGLGLGLYITRLLVEAQGGTIEVESQLGQGSTFRVRFAGACA